jgi:type VI secretion system secreted protein Hcp
MADLYAFLDLEGIEGEAQDSKFEKHIELNSVSWGATNASSFGSGTGASVTKGDIHEISFSKTMCKASMRIFERCVNGQHFKKGKLTLCKLAGENNKIPYCEIDMKHVTITSYHLSASDGGQLPMETGSIHFVEVMTKYLPQSNTGDASGNIGFGWDLQRNEKLQ